MKKSILILALLTASLVSAQDLVWQSYTDFNGEQSYPIAFYSDGSIFSQDILTTYLRDPEHMDLLDGVSGIRKLVNDIKTVQKKKVNNHVLEDFKDDEEEKIKEITENIVKQIPTLIDKKIDLFFIIIRKK